MNDWRRIVRLSELSRGPVRVELAPDEATRAVIARDLGLESLPAFRGTLTVKPWLDGAEITGRFEARVEQICGISLDPFETELAAGIEMKVVPPGSPNAPVESPGSEVEFDLDAPEPPDVLDGDDMDLAAYLVEHLALEIDPFPRKPGVAFEYEPETKEESPFAVLRSLKDKDA